MGLDISTSITGITILDKTGKVVICNAWDLRKYKGFFLKVEKTKVFLEEIAQNQEIEKIFIEQSLQSFRTGFSSAQTSANPSEGIARAGRAEHRLPL